MNNDLVELIAVAVAAAMAERMPERELWDAKMIGHHMGVSAAQVLSRYACLPDFPKAIRIKLPNGGRGHPYWKPVEVRAWWEGHREDVSGRRRGRKDGVY